jgi:hypothetical protein
MTFSEARVALEKERVSSPAVMEVLPSQEPTYAPLRKADHPLHSVRRLKGV